ncbi:hypothetical protein [uncultured Mucilaginibacter sp.]|uniref:hypothetical protein n=1 Tax=uncultured Mucilaginibacter sp. TaxID=797541 RepID=UPI0026005253|nr:hypothetical protein [uncultured Mucilaginibacter sp.]
MKKISILSLQGYLAMILLTNIIFVSCKNNSGQFTAGKRAIVKDSVIRMITNISKDVSAKGPGCLAGLF